MTDQGDTLPGVLAEDTRTALEMVARRPVRRDGNPWGIRPAVAERLLTAGLIEGDTASDRHNTWRIWTITPAGRAALASVVGLATPTAAA